MTPAPICLRTPDRLHPSDVVMFEDATPETVLRVHELDDNAHLVRTKTNLRFVRADELVHVLAVSVPGIGYVSPQVAD